MPPSERINAAVRTAHAVDVREKDELLGTERLGDLARRGVRIEVQRGAVLVHADRCNDRNEPCAISSTTMSGCTLRTSPTRPMSTSEPSRSFTGGILSARMKRSSFARETHRASTVLADQRDDVLVDHTGEHHLRDFHGRIVGDTQPVHEARGDRELLEHIVTCGPPPCTTTTLMPMYFSSTTSLAKLSFSSGATIA